MHAGDLIPRIDVDFLGALLFPTLAVAALAGLSAALLHALLRSFRSGEAASRIGALVFGTLVHFCVGWRLHTGYWPPTASPGLVSDLLLLMMVGLPLLLTVYAILQNRLLVIQVVRNQRERSPNPLHELSQELSQIARNAEASYWTIRKKSFPEIRDYFADLVSGIDRTVRRFQMRAGEQSAPPRSDVAYSDRFGFVLGIGSLIFSLVSFLLATWTVPVPREWKFIWTFRRWVEHVPLGSYLSDRFGGQPGAEGKFVVWSTLLITGLAACASWTYIHRQNFNTAWNHFSAYLYDVRSWADSCTPASGPVQATEVSVRRWLASLLALFGLILSLAATGGLIHFFPIGFSMPRWEIERALLEEMKDSSQLGDGTRIDRIHGIYPRSDGETEVRFRVSTETRDGSIKTFENVGRRFKGAGTTNQ